MHNDIRRNVYGLHKHALLNLGYTATSDFLGTMKDLTLSGSVMLLAAAAAAGTGIGYVAAEMTSHGKQDLDTAKKEYENERLKADLGYAKSKANVEYEAFKNKTKPTAARVIA